MFTFILALQIFTSFSDIQETERLGFYPLQAGFYADHAEHPCIQLYEKMNPLQGSYVVSYIRLFDPQNKTDLCLSSGVENFKDVVYLTGTLNGQEFQRSFHGSKPARYSKSLELPILKARSTGEKGNDYSLESWISSWHDNLYWIRVTDKNNNRVFEFSCPNTFSQGTPNDKCSVRLGTESAHMNMTDLLPTGAKVYRSQIERADGSRLEVRDPIRLLTPPQNFSAFGDIQYFIETSNSIDALVRGSYGGNSKATGLGARRISGQTIVSIEKIEQLPQLALQEMWETAEILRVQNLPEQTKRMVCNRYIPHRDGKWQVFHAIADTFYFDKGLMKVDGQTPVSQSLGIRLVTRSPISEYVGSYIKADEAGSFRLCPRFENP